MKHTKQLLCILLAVLMTASVCGGLLSSAEAVYSFVEQKDKAYDVAEGVHYSEYTLSSGIYDSVFVSASALEFNTDDYAVIAYAGAAGGAAYLANQYKLAEEDGYEVVGIINGSFFSMDSSSSPNGNYGYLNEYLVSNGVICSADNDNAASEYDGMVCINSDGTVESVPNSSLHFNLYLNGSEIPGGISYVNKTAGFKKAENWSGGFYYFDHRSGDMYYEKGLLSNALTYEICPGYEVLCRKLNGTELTVGGTLEAEVISVTPNTYGGAIGEDEFILFVKNDSPNASYVSSLKAGDTVTVSASETVADSAEATSGAQSIIANVGYLVKDGVNLTLDASFNNGAAHSNTTKARWTAFGIKADGSWVFFTTEGASTGSDGSVTLQDVAKAMMEMGCVDVIRMDGGGSSAMYVCDDGTGKPGFKQKSSRSVGDCLMVVKRTSPALQTEETLKNNVASLIEQAQEKKDDTYVASALAFAKAVSESTTSISGDYQIAYMRLRYALSGKNQLGDLMSKVAGITYTDYSEYILGNLRTAYASASAVFGKNATAEEISAAYEELNKWYALSGDVTVDGTEYKKVESGAYLTGLNLKILTGYCSIYTPGTNITGVNLNWSQVTLVRYSEEAGAYLVEQNFFGNGQAAKIISSLGFEVVPEDCLVIGTHGDSGTDAINKEFVASAKVGQKLVLYGIDPNAGTIGIGAYFTFADVESAYEKGDVDGDGELHAKDYMKLKRHVLKTFKLTEEECKRADVNGDGEIDAKDYTVLKRAILGTYQL